MCNIPAAIIAATAVTANESRRTRNAASDAASQQAQAAREAEERRIAQAEAEAAAQRAAEERRQQNIAAGQGEISSLFGQFDDNFYNQRSKSYLDYALPQLDQQFQDQQRNLVAQLSRTGNLQSSLRADQLAKLQQQYDRSKLQIQDTAGSYAANARASVEQARSKLIESNASLADPGTIRTMAQAQAQGLSVAPQYQGLGQLIANMAASVPNNPAGSAAAAGSGVTLYGTSGAGRVVS